MIFAAANTSDENLHPITTSIEKQLDSRGLLNILFVCYK